LFPLSPQTRSTFSLPAYSGKTGAAGGGVGPKFGPVTSNPLHFFALCLLGENRAGGRGRAEIEGAETQCARKFGTRWKLPVSAEAGSVELAASDRARAY